MKAAAVLLGAVLIAGEFGPVAHEPASAAVVAGDSIYQLPVNLTLADGTGHSLAQLRGRPVLVTLFYASCDGVCPLLTFSMRRTVAALPPQSRDGLHVLMVSLDPKHDSPQKLRDFAQMHQVDRPGWWLASTSEQDVRKLAAVLGIRYRELPDGVISHSAVVTLLDAEGVIRAQSTNMQELDPALISAIGAALR